MTMHDDGSYHYLSVLIWLRNYSSFLIVKCRLSSYSTSSLTLEKRVVYSLRAQSLLTHRAA